MAFNEQLKEYLAKIFGATPLEPEATAANAYLAYKAVPQAPPQQLGVHAAIPSPETEVPPPSAPLNMPQPAPVPPQAPSGLPSPTAAPSMPPVASRSNIPMPGSNNPVQSVYGSKYDDTARQQLYDSLAQKRGANAGWAAIGDVADLNANVGGGTMLNSGDKIRARQSELEKTAKGDFEAGRESKLKDATANIALQKAGREDTEYKDANDPNSQMSKLAAGLAGQLLGPEKVAKLGWAPGKSTYADVIKVLPILEKQVQLEIAKSNKDITLGTKQGQFNENLTTKLRGQIENHPAYKNYLTLHGATEQAKRAIDNPSAYGDLSLIYSTIKGLDAQSSVREGEVKTMAEMASLKNRLLGSLQTVASGQHLTPEQKADAKNVIASMEKIAKDNVISTANPILAQAKRAGLQEGEINPLYQAPVAPATPAAGQPIAAGWKVVR